MTTTPVGSGDDVRNFLHRLRNRMTVIGGYLSLAQSPPALADEAKRSAYIEAAITEVRRAVDLKAARSCASPDEHALGGTSVAGAQRHAGR